MKISNFVIFFVVGLVSLVKFSFCQGDDLLVVSVATEETDGYKRFVRSLKVYGYKYEIFGMGEEWKGGDVTQYAGGGHKVNILKRELEKYKDDANKIILFTDSYDVIMNQEPGKFLEVFKSFNSRVVFSAEVFCWPDPSLASQYPEVPENEKRFLNSGSFAAYAPELYRMVTSSSIGDTDDDQLFYTKLFLDKIMREELSMKLDTQSKLFRNLNGAGREIFLTLVENHFVLTNEVNNTYPVIVHGNGPSKVLLNRIGNYIAKAWSSTDGCLSCKEDKIALSENTDEWPEVTVGIFVERPTPFLREFFEKISKLNYPKSKLSVLVHNNIKYHAEDVAAFFTKNKGEYKTLKYISPEEDSPDYEARSEAVKEAINSNSKYFFMVDATAHLDNPHTLSLLIEQNRPILAPIMVRKDTSWSNMWGDITEQGFYQRADDYIEIIENRRFGVWNVPYINEAILMTIDKLKSIKATFEDSILDSDMIFAKSLRAQGTFMYATNMAHFGHLITPDTFNTSLTKPEMYEIFTNFDDWEKRYIHAEYYKYLQPETVVPQPCSDVFWFPIVSEEFCTSLIEMMETFGQWSGGKNNDPRLPGGYENVPTVDIHMRQVNWEPHWLHFLRKFVMPMQQKLYIGYFHDPPSALLNFVVRYHPQEQNHLRPHHDASTYTINIALNNAGIDYEGGGVRFVRYNCSVTDTKVGWTFMHPGRLTHYHEGLLVTKGTRYIMVSFVDP